jgi:hypothetical protein
MALVRMTPADPDVKKVGLGLAYIFTLLFQQVPGRMEREEKEGDKV